MDAFREARLRRARRQAVTLARAMRAARKSLKTSPPRTPRVNGTALRDLLAEVAAEAKLVEVPVNRAPWTGTGLEVAAGEQVTWLAWGMVNLIKPLGIVATAHQALAGRVGPGPALRSPRDTLTFSADRSGMLELGAVFPAGGELNPDGSVKTDRIPYRVQKGSLAAVVARWAPGTDPREALGSVAARDASGLCAAEAARSGRSAAPASGLGASSVDRPRGDLFGLSGRHRRSVQPDRGHHPATGRGSSDADAATALVVAAGRAALAASRGHDAHARLPERRPRVR